MVEGLFSNVLVLLLFFVPALSMRAYAEERNLGTDELLLTAPVGPTRIVLGKYLGLLAVAGVLLGATVLYLSLVVWRGDPEIGPIASGLLGLTLAVAALCALGLAVSTLTSSQMMAAVGSFVVFLGLYVVGWPADSVRGVGSGPPARPLAPAAIRVVLERPRRDPRSRVFPLADRPRPRGRAPGGRLAAVEVALREGLRLAGLGGVVLLLFGLVSYAWTGRFDLWVAVHGVGGTIAAAAAFAHDIWLNVVKGGHQDERQQVRVARATALAIGAVSIALAIGLKSLNVAFLVGLAFAVAASANVPAILLALYWRGFTATGLITGMVVGLVSSLVLTVLSPAVMGVDPPGAAARHLIQVAPLFPLENPGIVSVPLGFLAAVVGSLLSRSSAVADRYDELVVRANTGLGAS